MRGGSWNNNQDNARSAYRNNNTPDNRNNNLGFRVVCSSLQRYVGCISCTIIFVTSNYIIKRIYNKVSPICQIQTIHNKMVKSRIRPVANTGSIAMFDRVVMEIRNGPGFATPAFNV